MATDDTLARIIADTNKDLSALLPSVRERIVRRIQAAYWIGANHGMDTPPLAAERRSEPRIKSA